MVIPVLGLITNLGETGCYTNIGEYLPDAETSKMNLDSLEHYEPSMFVQEIEEQVLPTIEDLAKESQEEFEKYTIFFFRISLELLDRGNMTLVILV
jgi:hypothetical protein